MIRTEITGAEIAEEMEKERRLFQLQMCEVSSLTIPIDTIPAKREEKESRLNGYILEGKRTTPQGEQCDGS